MQFLVELTGVNPRFLLLLEHRRSLCVTTLVSTFVSIIYAREILQCLSATAMIAHRQRSKTMKEETMIFKIQYLASPVSFSAMMQAIDHSQLRRSNPMPSPWLLPDASVSLAPRSSIAMHECCSSMSTTSNANAQTSILKMMKMRNFNPVSSAAQRSSQPPRTRRRPTPSPRTSPDASVLLPQGPPANRRQQGQERS